MDDITPHGEFDMSELEAYRAEIYPTMESILARLEGLGSEGLNWRPDVPDANSMYAIAMHVMGSTEEGILSTLCGRTVNRDRNAELRAEADSSVDLRGKWNDLRARMDEALSDLSTDDLNRVRKHPRRDILLTGRDAIVHVVQHTGLHLGHIELTRDLYDARRS